MIENVSTFNWNTGKLAEDGNFVQEEVVDFSETLIVEWTISLT